MSSDEQVSTGEAQDELDDLEATDPDSEDVKGGSSAGKGGSIVVMDPTNGTRHR